ncbi:hypothetical protein, partial [Morganella morganii]|uniref:hypothetical protein n=1 Tax=Morganella morganii TaxID=582 RepID=UPI001C8CD4B7
HCRYATAVYPLCFLHKSSDADGALLTPDATDLAPVLVLVHKISALHALAVISPFGIIGLRFILSCLRMSPFCERS